MHEVQLAEGKVCKVPVDEGAHYYGPPHTEVAQLVKRFLRPDQVIFNPKNYGTNPTFRSLCDGGWRDTPLRDCFLAIQGLDLTSPWLDRVSMASTLALYHAVELSIDVECPWNTPLASWLDRITMARFRDWQRLPQWIAEMWNLGVQGVHSIRPEETSLLYWAWYNASNSGLLFTCDDQKNGQQAYSMADVGYGGLLQKYAAASDVTIRMNSPVTHVDHSSPTHVVLTLADGSTVKAKRVVIAASPAAIGKHLRFAPSLHPARALLHSQRMGHAAKATLFYEEAWWRDLRGSHLYGTGAGDLTAEIEWCLDVTDNTKGGGGLYTMMAFVSPGLFERLGDEALPETVEAAIAEALGDAFDTEKAKDRLKIVVRRWRDVPFVGGGPNTAFSLGVLSDKSLAEVFNQPEGPNGRLYFAASEYSTNFTGYVEGAIRAGKRVVRQIAFDEGKAARADNTAARTRSSRMDCGRPLLARLCAPHPGRGAFPGLLETEESRGRA